MTCEEFHGAFNAWLDGKKTAAMPPDARGHAATCAACARYAAAMEGIDAGLRKIPPVEIPATLLALPDELEEGESSRRGRVIAVARFLSPALVPAAAVWCAAPFLPPPWAGFLCFILATSGLAMFGVASLRPRFVD